MKKLLLCAVCLLAAMTIKAQIVENDLTQNGKSAFLLLASSISELPTENSYIEGGDYMAENPEQNAANWYNTRFVKNNAGVFINTGQISTAIANGITTLWVNIDRVGLDDIRTAGISDAVVADLKAYVEAGGNLLLTKQATMIAHRIGRIYQPTFSAEGYNLGGDVWAVNPQMGLSNGYMEAFDRSNHPVYADVEWDEGLYTYRPSDESDYEPYKVLPLVSANRRTDNNCMWIELYRKDPDNPTGAMPETEGVTHYQNNDSLRLIEFESDWNVTMLGSWGQVIDFCAAGLVEMHPEENFNGIVMAIGFAAYQWGNSNAYVPNVKKLTENSINYLTANPRVTTDSPTETDSLTVGTDTTDHLISVWNTLPAEYVVSVVCPADAAYSGLKSVSVFADPDYINILLEPNLEELPERDWMPLDIFLNTDNSDTTGGCRDPFTDANADVLLEGSLFAENEIIEYSPAVYKWWGEVGGEGWMWYDPETEPADTNCWGAIVCEGALADCTNKYANGKFVIVINRTKIPAIWSDEEFGIGFSILQNWSTAGILPLESPTKDNQNGLTQKLQVPIYPEHLPLFRSEEQPTTVSIFGQEVIIIDPEDSTAIGEVDVLGDSTLIYNTEDNTLTFNGLTLESDDSITAAIRYEGSEPLTIVLNDSSAIIADTVISATADIIIRGDGYLEAEGVIPIIGVETATITFDSVSIHVRSLPSSAAVRRRIRGIKNLDESGGPALSGFASADFNKTVVTPPEAEYGEVETQESWGGESGKTNALYVINNAGEKEVLTEFTLTAVAAGSNAVENTSATSKATKQLINGQLYLLHGDRIYDAQGRQVR